MPTFRSPSQRDALIQRLQRLGPDAQPRWGSLTAPRLLCHLCDTLAMAVGELPVPPMNKRVFHHFPMKHLILYVLPFPRGVPTSRELLSSSPASFDADRQRVLELIARLAASPGALGPSHPLFGPLNNDEWNALQAKHLAHHLTQFGL